MPKSTEDSFVDRMQESIRQQVGDRLLLAKMETAEKVATLAGKFVVAAALSLLLFFVMLFLSFMGAYYFAQVFDSFFIGFAIVSGVYLLIFLLLLWKGKKPLANFIESTIIATIFEHENEDDEASDETNGKPF